ncbi:MAG TPA: peptidase M28, partial [Sphingomicrobium sp.]|nr:peptidase M28 [Sphingomicrobium sp.]
MSLKTLLVAASAVLLVGAAPSNPRSDSLAAERVRAHVEFLASDLLEGRDTGSRGHQIAASYVASEFRELGLKPGGTNGSWFVDVPFRRASLAAPPAIALKLSGKTSQLAAGKDAAVRPSVTHRDLDISAPLVFVGHGVRDARLGIDDYAGLDVSGKIVVALSDPVQGIPTDVAAHLLSVQPQ